MREAIESLERILLQLRPNNPGLSDAGLIQLAWLRHRLEWCNECSSRYRSQKLLMWVAKRVAEVVIRVMGASFCTGAAVRLTQSTYAYNRKDYQNAA